MATPLPTLDTSDEEMIAYAITEPLDQGRLQVVGRSVTQQVAVLWERDEFGLWTALDLNAPGVFCDDSWTQLLVATDINDLGWIVGYGTKQGEQGARAFVLIPEDCDEPGVYCCIGDINRDGVVDVSDLLALLAAWGDLPPIHVPAVMRVG